LDVFCHADVNIHSPEKWLLSTDSVTEKQEEQNGVIQGFVYLPVSQRT
jgi:hypothetical protein